MSAVLKLKDTDISQTLSDSQKLGIEAVMCGMPLVVVQGGAGSGKSAFLFALRDLLESPEGGEKCVAVAAPTGIAALNVEGQTIHSLFKLPTHLIDVRGGFKPKAVDALKEIDVLVLDEKSMIRADILDAIDLSLRVIRKDQRPFGGVQVVLIGDVMQLPPVITRDEEQMFYQMYASPWFFDSHVMQYMAETGQYVFVWFRETFRQADEGFVRVLQSLRRGNEPQKVVDYLNASCLNLEASSHIVLTSYRKDAERINTKRLHELSGSARTFKGRFSGKFSKSEGNLPAPSELTLKEGAQVMVTRNVSGLANGTLATVKSMGKDFVVIEVLDGGGTETLTAASWKQYGYASNKKSGFAADSVGSYTQIPLTLGYAQTIHRAQGLTLPSATIDLGRGAFAGGQTYVALSRCRKLEDVTLARPLRVSDIQASDEARAWLRSQTPYASNRS